MENITLKDFLGYGLQGFQTVIIWMLWNRLNQVTDRMFSMMGQAAAERQAIARRSGLTSQDLSDAVDQSRGGGGVTP